MLSLTRPSGHVPRRDRNRRGAPADAPITRSGGAITKSVQNEFAVVRLQRGGKLDRGFGDGGIELTQIGSNSWADAVAVTPHADILLHHAVTSPTDGDTEGQPLAILEAMAAGVAVITTDHAGIPELVTDGVNGRLVAIYTVAAPMVATRGHRTGTARARRRRGGVRRDRICAHATLASARGRGGRSEPRFGR